ncbi:MAG: hypothetical protein K0S19_1589 [Geminicoccaceae bacterium]|nr:hypothetical protein [Geminicoccaceae bacterium]
MNFFRNPSRALLSNALPLVVGALTFAVVWVGRSPPGPWGLDFDYFWTAGRAVWQGDDPYLAVDAAIRDGTLRWPFFYPGTAAVLLAPFGALPHQLAAALFTSLGMGLLVWSVRGWRRWIVLSPPALEALLIGQWSPWLTAAVGIPWLGFIWAAKPSIGVALFAGWPSRAAVYGGLAVVILSFVLLPQWPTMWLEAVQNSGQYRAPVQRFGGFVLLLAWLRWRKPEARLLGVLSLIPHTTSVYELLPLFLVPQTKRSFGVLLGLSLVATAIVYVRYPYGGSLSATLDARWPYLLILVYLPALLMVLRSPTAGSSLAAPEETGDIRPRDGETGAVPN